MDKLFTVAAACLVIVAVTAFVMVIVTGQKPTSQKSQPTIPMFFMVRPR